MWTVEWFRDGEWKSTSIPQRMMRKKDLVYLQITSLLDDLRGPPLRIRVLNEDGLCVEVIPALDDEDNEDDDDDDEAL